MGKGLRARAPQTRWAATLCGLRAGSCPSLPRPLVPAPAVDAGCWDAKGPSAGRACSPSSSLALPSTHHPPPPLLPVPSHSCRFPPPALPFPLPHRAPRPASASARLAVGTRPKATATRCGRPLSLLQPACRPPLPPFLLARLRRPASPHHHTRTTTVTDVSFYRCFAPRPTSLFSTQ